MGSSKAHLGHTQAAAGVTGLVSMVQAIRSGTLPADPAHRRALPDVDWTSGQVGLLTEPTPWPETGRPRRRRLVVRGISGGAVRSPARGGLGEQADLAGGPVDVRGRLVDHAGSAGRCRTGWAGPLETSPVTPAAAWVWPRCAFDEPKAGAQR